jgi:hypothetical protein
MNRRVPRVRVTVDLSPDEAEAVARVRARNPLIAPRGEVLRDLIRRGLSAIGAEPSATTAPKVTL